MRRKCNVCRRSYDTPRPSQSKFCSAKCRVRNHENPGVYSPVPDQPRSKKPGVAAGSVDAVVDSSCLGDSNSLVKATLGELEAAGVVDTMLGQQALRIATQMSGFETAGGMAALSKELSRVMVEALRAGAAASVDPVDELAARRDAKLAAG